MVIQASGFFLPTPDNTIQETVDVHEDFDTPASSEHFLGLKSLAEEEFSALNKKDSPQTEKQISVDPMSLRESSDMLDLMLPPIIPPDLPPVKPQLISCSLPSSASSSPRFGFKLLKKKRKNDKDLSLSLQQEIQLPVDELDLWLNKSNPPDCNNGFHATREGNYYSKTGKNMYDNDEEFKCRALCLYLPGFGKAKAVRTKKEEVVEPEPGNVISRTVSLEKFECGSWASSAIMNDHEDDSMNLYFDLPLELIRTSANDATSPVAAAFLFDKDHKGVPKNSCVTKAMPRKSHESSRHVRFSTSSSSPTSYPASPASCITPRLRKAREDFNAFLEAQSA